VHLDMTRRMHRIHHLGSVKGDVSQVLCFFIFDEFEIHFVDSFPFRGAGDSAHWLRCATSTVSSQATLRRTIFGTIAPKKDPLERIAQIHLFLNSSGWVQGSDGSSSSNSKNASTLCMSCRRI